jgi:hypothetical protein
VNITTETSKVGDVWQAVLNAPANEWAIVTLPIKEFLATWRGHIDDVQVHVLPTRIQSLGILQAQRKEGPFHLEIEYIKIKKTIQESKRYNLE